MPLREALILFGCLVVAVILHEISHGVVALWCGDHTARRAGRLTLNPVPHIDPFGSLILPAMGALAGLPILGYAKPVPVNPNGMRHPRRDMVFVSLAGPTSNFLLMFASAIAARALVDSPADLSRAFSEQSPDLLVQILYYFSIVNLLLGVFNLLPIPPLDGSALIERVLPADWLPTWYRFRPYGILVLLGLVFFTGIVGSIIAPFQDVLYDFVVG